MKINPSEIRSAQFIDTYYPIVDGVVQTVHNYAELMNRSGYACVVTPKPLKKEYDDSDLIYEVYRTALIGLPVAEYGMPAPRIDRKVRDWLADRDLQIFHAHSPFFEGTFASSYAKKLGVNVDTLLISQPDNGEQALEIADSLIRSGAIDIVVIDSVAALTPKAEIEGDMGDSKMGLQARLMSQALRKLTANISKTNTCCIFINQLREKIGIMFGNPETTTGGNALKFYASVRLDVRKLSQLKDGDDATGNRARVKVVKNKMAPPFRKAEFDIVFGEGISKVGEIVDLGVDLDIIKKSGSWFSYGDSKLAQGREAVKQLLKDNPELCEEIEAKVRQALQEVKD